ncbi:diguanylate cyclase (GGDEF)-like protein [Paraburkholderia unamae]|nr:diguanylate cyclase (GGDEF)-like protein [Paraburkholderia unamae]
MQWVGIHPFIVGTMGTLVGAAIVAIVLLGLMQQRRQAIESTQQQSAALVALMSNDLEANFGIYDLLLVDAVESIRDPRTVDLPPDIRRKLLFSRVATGAYLDDAFYADATGHIVESRDGETYPGLNVADRDYFMAQRDRSVGMYVSDPIRSRARDGHYSIALSRRVSNYDGSFDGVVLLTLRLAYFQQLFDRVEVDPQGTMFIMLSDGTMLARRPYSEYEVGAQVGARRDIQPMLKTGSGSFIGVDPEDGIVRIHTFKRVPHTSLIAVVAPSLDGALAAWRHRLWIYAPMAVVFGLLIAASSWMLALSMRGRLETQKEFERLSVTDGLTGLFNRRALDQRMESEWQRARRQGEPLSVLFVDIDRFKLFNDFYGHSEGDKVLAAVASAIRAASRRATDMVARYGGEEFAVVLPATNFDGAVIIAEAVRREVASLGIVHEHSEYGAVTVSIGSATCVPRESEGAQALLRAADAELYAAKEGGRNKVKAREFEGAPPDPRDSLPTLPKA